MPNTHYPLNHSDEPIRLFRSDFLEFFTHISPVTVLVIWLPAVGYLLWRAVVELPVESQPAIIPAGFGVGLCVWTFIEYILHRFVFHFPPTGSPAMERIVFLFHGVHHAQPQLKTRLVMPPVVSLPMAFIFYFIFLGICSAFQILDWLYPLFAGALFGYICYDMIHYATHHFPMRWGPLKFLKRYHMQHHFKTENARFGVSSPVWDLVFGTMPPD